MPRPTLRTVHRVQQCSHKQNLILFKQWLPLTFQRQREWKVQIPTCGKKGNLQRMDEWLLKPQEWDPGISAAAMAQSKIPGKSRSHIDALLWTSSPHAQWVCLPFSVQTFLLNSCPQTVQKRFFLLFRGNPILTSVTSASSKILDSQPELLSWPRITFLPARLWPRPDQFLSYCCCDTLSTWPSFLIKSLPLHSAIRLQEICHLYIGVSRMQLKKFVWPIK